MRCRINFQSDPISLVIIAATGTEHQFLEEVGQDGLVEVPNMVGRIQPGSQGIIMVPITPIDLGSIPIREPAQPKPIASMSKPIRIVSDADRIKALEI